MATKKSTPPAVKPIKFRLYPEGDGLHFLVLVFPDRTSMMDHLAKQDPCCVARYEANKTQGVCRPSTTVKVTKSGTTRFNPCCGTIVLHEGFLDAEVASHEITHAALEWARRKQFLPTRAGKPDQPNVSDEEERFCYAVGRMVGQFAYHATRRKIWAKHT